MTETLKNFYKTEYELDRDATPESLAKKYGFNVAELGDTSRWAKAAAPKPAYFDFLPTKEFTPDYKPKAPPVEFKRNPTATNLDIMKENILEFKKLVIQEAINRVNSYGDAIATKDLKELTMIVDTIEKSFKTIQEGANINVLVQQIINNIGDDV